MFAAIAIGVAALALILLLLTVVIRTLTKPLIKLAETMEQLANGGGDLTSRIAIANRDEIGRTAYAFNRFLDSLRDMFIQVRSKAARFRPPLASSAIPPIRCMTRPPSNPMPLRQRASVQQSPSAPSTSPTPRSRPAASPAKPAN
ncbi:hypothetical protein BI343_14815 [Chromobacterium amazonense]|nr:hypothetical protein BI343_14815 [Chromobacterium amazonense]